MNPAEAGPSRAIGSDKAEAISLLGPVFRPNAPERLALEHPLVFGPRARGDVRLVREGERAVAGAAFLVFELRTKPETGLKVGAIGSVGTHPEFRKRGLGQRAMEACESAILESGACASVLWSQAPEFYRKQGYREIGIEEDYVISAELALKQAQASGAVVPVEGEKDLRSAWQLYSEQTVGTRRSLEDFRELASIPGMQMFQHRRLAKMQAYAAFERGADFSGAIHEWAGDPQGVLAIARYLVLQKARESLVVISSAACAPLREAFRAWSLDPLPGILGMLKILDRRAFFSAIEPALDAIGLQARPGGDAIRVSRNDATMDLDEGEFLRLLFGFRGVSGEAFQAAAHFGVTALRERPPLEAFLWGLDTV